MTSLLPDDVTRGVADALGDVADTPSSISRVGGGCIHPAARITTRSGKTVFLKWAVDPGPSPFPIEARGLQALGATEGPRVPHVLGVGPGDPESRGWLLLEHVTSGIPDARSFETLGGELAALHRPVEGVRPGWDEDGWIGSLPQPNAPRSLSWPAFWRDVRLDAQWRSARSSFDRRDREGWDRLSDLLEQALRDSVAEGLSLLHGDLWRGNVMVDDRGRPTLVDPAAYYGHREVDLAMMELFGGFDPIVFESYFERAPVGPGYAELRRDIYQLYPLLVHVNLFGGAYVPGVCSRMRRLLSELG